MAEVQTTYATSMPVGYAGMIANGETSNRISRTADEALNFGQPAFRGAQVHTCQAGAAFSATGTGSAAAGNVGTSSISASPTVAAGAKPGRYVFTQLNTSGTGALQAVDPDGVVVGHGNVGTAFTIAGITATVTAAGTPTAGDQFYVDVALGENASFLGLTIADKTLPANASNPDQYPQYANVGIMTTGVMWVTAGATVAAGDDVYWNPSTSRYTKTTTHIPIPNARFDTGGANGDLVRVAIRH